ncbi:hypothetical protein [Paenibacillus chungangensis]|uniref:Uncharacterized protein n=1 Tax=Paenibacillus chungangensis TaxID=696535 RepID=A0ABW3HUZ1_9BACL
MEDRQLCPWCATEIVWDEELGPESHCPHCENELGGYRSLEMDLDNQAEDDDINNGDGSDEAWLENEEGYTRTSRSMLAAGSVMQRIIDEQDEAPECPSCREYMLEAGTQTMGGAHFQPFVPEATGQPLLPNPFHVKWYICPACHQATSQLALEERLHMLKKLAD